MFGPVDRHIGQQVGQLWGTQRFVGEGGSCRTFNTLQLAGKMQNYPSAWDIRQPVRSFISNAGSMLGGLVVRNWDVRNSAIHVLADWRHGTGGSISSGKQTGTSVFRVDVDQISLQCCWKQNKACLPRVGLNQKELTLHRVRIRWLGCKYKNAFEKLRTIATKFIYRSELRTDFCF